MNMLSATRISFQMYAAREAPKYLQVGVLSETKHKTRPSIAKAVGADAQALHHVLA
jgi:hypothetical protein